MSPVLINQLHSPGIAEYTPYDNFNSQFKVKVSGIMILCCWPKRVYFKVKNFCLKLAVYE